MAKILAIHSGDDWTDADVDYVILPEGMDFEAEKRAYRKWYTKEYAPALKAGVPIPYKTLSVWLAQRGAVDPGDDQLEVVWDE